MVKLRLKSLILQCFMSLVRLVTIFAKGSCGFLFFIEIINLYPFPFRHPDRLPRPAAIFCRIIVTKAAISKLHKSGISYFHTAVIIMLRHLLNAVSRPQYIKILAFLFVCPPFTLFCRAARQNHMQLDLRILLL